MERGCVQRGAPQLHLLHVLDFQEQLLKTEKVQSKSSWKSLFWCAAPINSVALELDAVLQ